MYKYKIKKLKNFKGNKIKKKFWIYNNYFLKKNEE